MDEGGDDALQPVALLMDELKSDDASARAQAVRRVHTIALALGPSRSVSELLPFLAAACDEEDDEVLAALAEELGTFCGAPELLGGAVEAMVPVLEAIVCAEEPFVRTAAVASFERVLSVIGAQKALDYALPAVERLARGDWHAKRMSAAQLLPSVLAVSGEVQRGLEAVLVPLGEDDAPLVRKAAAGAVTRLAPLLDGDDSSSAILIGCAARLASDAQDSVRLAVVEGVGALLALKPEARAAQLLPLFHSLAGDESWRVRFMAATHAARFAAGAPEEAAEVHAALLGDDEPEVRAAAATQLSSVARHCSAPLLRVLPTIAADGAAHVRSAAAAQLGALSRAVGPTAAAETVLPLALQFLRDDAADVRLGVISHLDALVDVLGVERLSASLLPAIAALAEDGQWRVRQTIVAHVPELAAHLGPAFFDGRLAPLVGAMLGDPVFAVRESAVEALSAVARRFGAEWASMPAGSVLSALTVLAAHRNYLRRQTAAALAAGVAPTMRPADASSLVLPLVQRLSADPIANVRICAARSLGVIASAAANGVAPWRSLLEDLERDPDADVRDAALSSLRLVPA